MDDHPQRLFPKLPGGILTTLSLIWILYLFVLAAYRLYFSPLAKFPGPKLAALTKFYELYYEVVLGGQFTFQIQKLHKEYGPIVRITPFELHIEDSDHWDELYSRSYRYDKYKWMSARFGNDRDVFNTASSALHAIRRNPLNQMFSKRRITAFEPVIREKVELLSRGIAEMQRTGEVFVLSGAYNAFTGDVITTYAFGFCYNHLESPGFRDNFHPAFAAVAALGHLTLQYPIIHSLINSLPDSIAEKMKPEVAIFLKLKKDVEMKIANIISGNDESKSEHPTIFHELLESKLPPPEKTVKRLVDEAMNMIGAGLETTAWALSVISLHLLSNPLVLQKLQTELRHAIPNPYENVELSALEKLPYLSACIQEGIRLSYGLSTRNPRVSPDVPMRYKDWLIPAGTPVSMTIVDVHHDEQYFPKSREYIPERWLDNPKTSDGGPLGRYFVSFGKGPRSCLGINLAFAELYLATATVFRRFEFELYETDASDVVLAHDFFLPTPKLDSKGVRVKVLSVDS